MKSTICFVLCPLLFILIGCSSDDDALPTPAPQPSNVIVEFGDDVSLFENSESFEVKLNFNKPAIKDGLIQIEIAFPENINLYTIPSSYDKLINLSVNKNDTYTSFSIIPENDQVIKGMKDISFSLTSVSEGFDMGSKKNLLVKLIDDELYGKPKSYETIAGNWKVSKTYIYGMDGRIHKIDWRNETPALTTGTDTYYYLNGKIGRINYSENHDENFYWDNDQIRSSEIIENGMKTSFATFEYNPEGYIASKTVYHPAPEGGYRVSLIYAYIYKTDGNLYKQITYVPDSSIDGYAVISQRTHDHYSDKSNLFPVNEIVPTLAAHKNLPGSYRVEENGEDLLYNFSYEFNSDGKAVKRETSGEVTTYSYY